MPNTDRTNLGKLLESRRFTMGELAGAIANALAKGVPADAMLHIEPADYDGQDIAAFIASKEPNPDHAQQYTCSCPKCSTSLAEACK